MHAQMQGQQIKANNLPYIQALIYNKPTQFVVDTGASRGICLATHANDIKQIATKIDYDPVSISGLMTTLAKCIHYTAKFPILFLDNSTKWQLLAWVATDNVNFKFNLL